MHLDGSLAAGVIRAPEVFDEFFARDSAVDRALSRVQSEPSDLPWACSKVPSM